MSDVAPAASPLTKIKEELAFLKANPQFHERPATLEEFLGPDYLNIRKRVRARILVELKNIMGEKVRGDRPTEYALAIVTGGIGIGKTTIASIVLPYLCHWVLCLKDPQDFFDLMPGSRIAFMQMSTSEQQAREVIFADIKARIAHSPWFQRPGNSPDPGYKNQIRFEKDIWIIPGDSSETTFEGYNILGGILDEADSHKVTQVKDYAEQGYTTIDSRIASRFQDRGFLLVIGQMKSAGGFAARKYEEFTAREDAYAIRLAIWDSMGEDFYEKDADGNMLAFYYDPKRRKVMSAGMAALVGTEGLLRIPETYRRQFENNPEKALRDLAGMPPAVGSPFIGLVDKIEAARDRWVLHHVDQWGKALESPVTIDGRLENWFIAPDSLKRVAHLDIAYSGEGDAYGFAMGHVPKLVSVDDELKPYIVIDMLWRLKAPPGSEIFLGTVRQMIYYLRSDRRFRLSKVTMDGFESTDTRQQLERKRFEAEYLSIDRQVLPYHDLREAIYEDRIEFPPYIVEMTKADGTHENVEILVKELSELVDNGNKIDHPVLGSKDVADTVAGVTFTLMGDRRFQRTTAEFSTGRTAAARDPAAAQRRPSHPAFRGDFSARAPLPPTTWSAR